MPRGDGTGPLGLGPMTGRAEGYCTGSGVPGSLNLVPGSWGRGRGGGRGFRNRFSWTGFFGQQNPLAWGYPGMQGGYYATSAAPMWTREQELEALKNQAKYFEDALQEIREQLQKVEGKTDK